MLHLAIEQLNALDTLDVLAVSDSIETKPVGGQTQHNYLNAVIHAATSLTATQLVSQLLNIERQLGRKRIRRWGPRSVDLDLLLLGDQIIDQSDATVPHPRMSFRRFVLEPASQIAPQLVHPVSGLTIAELLRCLNQRENEVAVVVLDGSLLSQATAIVKDLEQQASDWNLKIFESKKNFLAEKKDWKLVVLVTSDHDLTTPTDQHGDVFVAGPSLMVAVNRLAMELSAALEAMS